MTETHLEYIIKQMPLLETERLVLRKLTKYDYKDMYEYASNPDTSKYLTWSPHENVTYTKKYVKYIVSCYRTGEFSDWAIVSKDSGKMIGTCGYTSVDVSNSKVEIGYVLNPNFYRKGYAYEAVKKVLDYTFNDLELNRIEARVIEGNEASISLLRKFGFRCEGIGAEEMFVKNSFVDILHFAICKKDYSEQ